MGWTSYVWNAGIAEFTCHILKIQTLSRKFTKFIPISFIYQPVHPSSSSLLSIQSLNPSQTLEYWTHRLFRHLKLDEGQVPTIQFININRGLIWDFKVMFQMNASDANYRYIQKFRLCYRHNHLFHYKSLKIWDIAYSCT